MAIELPPLPEGFSTTREGMHRLAEDVIKPLRELNTGEFSLVRKPGGFGVPDFDGNGARVDGTELVINEDGKERRGEITTLAAAVELIGPRLLKEEPTVSERPLEIDADAAAALAAAFEVGEAALRKLVKEAKPGDSPSKPTLWPEHFDIAIELGSERAGLRANYGMSPGDAEHPEPYFYVGPWTATPDGDLWNSKAFNGAEITYTELAATEDPVAAALEFALERKRDLES